MIEVVGLGLESELTAQVMRLVSAADCLVGSHRHLGCVDKLPQKVSVIKIVLGDLTQAIGQLRSQVELHPEQSVVVLTSGDPLFFGLGRLLLQHFPKEKLRFHPHVSSVQLAFSRLQIPWQEAQIISAHGRSLDVLATALHKGVKHIAVLTDAVNTPAAIADFIHALQLPTHYQIWVCENLGSTDESIMELDRQGNTISSPIFAALNLVVLTAITPEQHPLPNLEQLPLLGIPDSEFLSFADQPGLMTKREVRVLSIGELALQPQQVIWDIGSGTGAMAIEIARFVPNSKVFAIEKTAAGITLIHKNCDRFAVKNVQVIAGLAPAALANLPAPDRIFLGGSSGKLAEILAVCRDRLQLNGLLVANFASPEHLHEAMTWLREHRYVIQLLQVNLARSAPIGSVSRFAPLNPVTILTARLRV